MSARRTPTPETWRWDTEENCLYYEAQRTAYRLRLWPNPQIWHRARPTRRWEALGPTRPTHLLWLDYALRGESTHRERPAGPAIPEEWLLWQDAGLDVENYWYDEDLPRIRGTWRRSTEAPPPELLARALASIPEAQRERLQRVAARGAAWTTHVAFARVPEIGDLADEVPALAAMAGIWPQFHPGARPWKALRALVASCEGMKRWRALAGWLKLDGSASFVNFLRKLPPPTGWHAHDLTGLGVLWADPLARKRLRHAEGLHVHTLAVLGAAHAEGVIDRVSDAFLATVPTGDGEVLVPHNLQRAASSWKSLHPRRPFPKLADVDALYAFIEELRAEILLRAGIVFENRAKTPAFPLPPFPGNEVITPLVSREALRVEGAEMGHCLGNGSWAEMALGHEGYAWSLRLGDERASLWLRQDLAAPTKWHVGEFRGVGNRPVPPALDVAARDWLASTCAALEAGTLTLGEPWHLVRSPPPGTNFPAAWHWALPPHARFGDFPF